MSATTGEFTLLKFKPRDSVINRVMAFIGTLAADKDWIITISLSKRTRSTAQNNYLHGVAYKILSERTGYEKAEVEDYCLGEYFGWKEKRVPRKPSNPRGIESVPIRRTTKDESGKRSVLTTLQFMEYVEFIQRFAAKHGWDIPDPDPEYFSRDHRRAA